MMCIVILSGVVGSEAPGNAVEGSLSAFHAVEDKGFELTTHSS